MVSRHLSLQMYLLKLYTKYPLSIGSFQSQGNESEQSIFLRCNTSLTKHGISFSHINSNIYCKVHTTFFWLKHLTTISYNWEQPKEASWDPSSIFSTLQIHKQRQILRLLSSLTKQLCNMSMITSSWLHNSSNTISLFSKNGLTEDMWRLTSQIQLMSHLQH